ncbi:hypothetical protein LO762_22060 [Actinocorallia sp. API 0066]|uniref:hypothetical protein n=1 Tax=Actinocorallia sp. API 0066 TaxID=2896846 RepID=UPI001E29A303|nr:hypothetical protein [Actinocorallia sp. API 0066]MCD0451860.1 hypothetical protein [Actinocorallia sp. API 0066]
MFRQGDILIRPIAESVVPEAVRALPPAPRDARGRMVLALGEATGHAHALAGPGTLRKGGPAGPDHLHLPEGGRLVHEEHAPITLPKGWYQIVRQREYVPGSVRPVAD